MIYLDYAATTPLDENVKKAMLSFKHFANPSSVHEAGREARDFIENAREKILTKLGFDPLEYNLIFTSGGTEANNLAILGLQPRHILSQKTEHKSVLNVLKHANAKISFAKTDKFGQVKVEEIKRLIEENKIDLITIMHANNELGTIQPLEEIIRIAKQKEIIVHTDACQSFLKVSVPHADLITINAHKIYGPKGIGALIIKNSLVKRVKKIMWGGNQEFGLRSGTENLLGIAGFEKAVELSVDYEKISGLKKYFIKKMLTLKGVKLNSPNKSIPTIANFSVPVKSDKILFGLSKKEIMISTGSACSENEPSYVLKEIGIKADQAIRISFGKNTTKDELDKTFDEIKKIIENENS